MADRDQGTKNNDKVTPCKKFWCSSFIVPRTGLKDGVDEDYAVVHVGRDRKAHVAIAHLGPIRGAHLQKLGIDQETAIFDLLHEVAKITGTSEVEWSLM